MKEIDSYISKNKERFINELLDFLRIPSVSADSKYKKDVEKTAEWVKTALIKAGADKVEIVPTKLHPIVYGEKIVDKKLPTILAYGHYDVQPPPIHLIYGIHHHSNPLLKTVRYMHAELVMIRDRFICTLKRWKCY